jgi:hypothetical protein
MAGEMIDDKLKMRVENRFSLAISPAKVELTNAWATHVRSRKVKRTSTNPTTPFAPGVTVER